MMRSLFYQRRRWQLGTCLAGVIAIALTLFIHGLLTLLASEPSSAVLARIHSAEVFTLITEAVYWNAQHAIFSAPFSESQLWWQPIAFVAALVLWILLWFLTGSGRLDRGLAVWAALVLSIASLFWLSNLNQGFNLSLAAETPQVFAFYLAIASLLLSLGHWRK